MERPASGDLFTKSIDSLGHKRRVFICFYIEYNAIQSRDAHFFSFLILQVEDNLRNEPLLYYHEQLD